MSLRRIRTQSIVSGAIVVILGITASPASPQLFNSTVDRLPVEQRVSLRNGEPVIDGENGQYTARILVTAPQSLVWEVLTDYGNASKFVPNVVSSKVLSTNGNQKVIEQIDVRRVFLVNIQSRIRSAITEIGNERIDFRQLEGDLQQMQGYWLVEPIAPYNGAKANQVLITQVITAQPKAGIPRSFFFDIFKNSLGGTLSSIRKEIIRRSEDARSSS